MQRERINTVDIIQCFAILPDEDCIYRQKNKKNVRISHFCTPYYHTNNIN